MEETERDYLREKTLSRVCVDIDNHRHSYLLVLYTLAKRTAKKRSKCHGRVHRKATGSHSKFTERVTTC